ncbi:hypothetical protein CO661_02315 [Sinorhizobium fredii]|uniref:Uncharacterized protein n=1 Tax=Rhizobium fredii TaxID=380 RepID=A0A2A6M7D0_RHIFR|nr:hypothetical protein CO661_02315 [Sinorhizobium fredii]
MLITTVDVYVILTWPITAIATDPSHPIDTSVSASSGSGNGNHGNRGPGAMAIATTIATMIMTMISMTGTREPIGRGLN